MVGCCLRAQVYISASCVVACMLEPRLQLKFASLVGCRPDARLCDRVSVLTV